MPSVLPLIQNDCTLAAFWVAFALGRTVHSGSALVLLRIETKFMCKSFLKSIEAPQASTADCSSMPAILLRLNAVI
eukprot:5122864-Pleurochrysis_carterae.AAC.2